MSNSQRIQNLPKIDLHCHLDGSVDPGLIWDFLRQQGREITQEELLDQLQVPDDCPSLAVYIERFGLPISCLQTRQNLTEAAYRLAMSAAQEGVVYLEVRYAPDFCKDGDMKTTAETIEAIEAGLARARAEVSNCGKTENGTRGQSTVSPMTENGTRGQSTVPTQSAVPHGFLATGIIACAMRHLPQEQNMKMFREARELLGSGLVAVDLAGDEAAFPMREFVPLFEAADHLGLPFTIHAGECGSCENVKGAIELGAKRVGHGIAMRESRALQILAADRHIGVEVCPVSNLQTKAIPSIREYPLRAFMQAGIPVSVNTDNRTVSNTSSTRELTLLDENFSLTDEELKQIYLGSVETAFADDTVKDRLWRLYAG